MIEEQSGHVTLGGERLGARLRSMDGRTMVSISQAGGDLGSDLPEQFDVLHFVGNRQGFTLLDLQRRHWNVRLGVGGLADYSVSTAIEDVLFDGRDEVASRSWTVYVEDLARIVHVTGLEQLVTVGDPHAVSIIWKFQPPPPLVLDCPKAGLQLRLGQDAHYDPDPIAGPRLSFRYQARLEFEEPRGLDVAVRLVSRIRAFLSMLMGRVLGIDELRLRFEDEDGSNDVRVHVHDPTSRSELPELPLLRPSPDKFAAMLDEWLVRYEALGETVDLHLGGLEQRRLPTQLRFQMFMQALEALDRRTSNAVSTPVDVASVVAALEDRSVAEDAIDRIRGLLAHSHEPGLRSRVKALLRRFLAQMEVLRPDIRPKDFAAHVVATRNYYAHRMDRDAYVLEGACLWNHTEAVKALVHIALLQEIGGEVAEMGRTMVDRRFVEFARPVETSKDRSSSP